MLTQKEVDDYIALHPCIKGQRSKWILEAMKHFNGLRWTEIQRLWTTSQGYNYDEFEFTNRIWDKVLDKWINLGGKARIHRGRGCDYFHATHGRPGLFARYCERRGNQWVVVKPIVGPWNPEKRFDGNKWIWPDVGQYGVKDQDKRS